MITKILEFMMQCPALSGAAFNVNYIDGMPISCTVESVGAEPVIKRYADGGTLCQARVAVAIRAAHSRSRHQNAEIADLCSSVEDWISNQDRLGILPEMSCGLRPLSLEVSQSFALDSSASVDALYRGELTLIYVKE